MWRGGVTDCNGLGKFAFGDRTIPIHARTLGPDNWGLTYKPERDGPWACKGVYYGTVQSRQWCTLTRPPLVRTHTSNPAFPESDTSICSIMEVGVGQSPLCQIRHLDLFDSVGGYGSV